jgi:D-amino peptidase
MEGIAGVVHRDDVMRKGDDYKLFRELMTGETNAAIEGALAAGATRIVVRDAHGSARNIFPDKLNKEAELIREWSGGPLSMMEGIDNSFDAVIFIGYHARAGAPGTLSHTFTGKIFELELNGRKMPEAGLNAAIAGHFGVPVILVAGDSAVCQEAEQILPHVETVAVKQGIGRASKNLHPEKARELIKKKARAALKRLKMYTPYKPVPPYTVKITLVHHETAYKASWIPGVKRVGERTILFTSKDFMEVLKVRFLAASFRED